MLNFSRDSCSIAIAYVREHPEDPILLAMGFVFAHPEVDTVLVGTHNPAHVLSNIQMVERGLPIPDEPVQELYRRFHKVGAGWTQLT